jgi:hypothetical protein
MVLPGQAEWLFNETQSQHEINLPEMTTLCFRELAFFWRQFAQPTVNVGQTSESVGFQIRLGCSHVEMCFYLLRGHNRNDDAFGRPFLCR